MSKSRRGFACLSPERRKAIAAKGGRSSVERGVSHRYSPEEARAAQAKSAASRKRNNRLAKKLKGAA
jgi:hypothetical protein